MVNLDPDASLAEQHTLWSTPTHTCTYRQHSFPRRVFFCNEMEVQTSWMWCEFLDPGFSGPAHAHRPRRPGLLHASLLKVIAFCLYNAVHRRGSLSPNSLQHIVLCSPFRPRNASTRNVSSFSAFLPTGSNYVAESSTHTPASTFLPQRPNRISLKLARHAFP